MAEKKKIAVRIVMKHPAVFVFNSELVQNNY